MTVYDVFNENLQRIPTLAMDAKKAIAVYGWPEMRKKHAYVILDQLCGGKSLVKEKCDCVGISLVELDLMLSPAECGIEGSDMFDEQNIKEGIRYVEELASDLTDLIKDVEFSFSGHWPKKTKSIFSIKWVF